jgi:hypothetical protein
MTLVNSLVTSQLDYGNVMLYGLPVNITNKLQRVQNTAARLISRTKKHALIFFLKQESDCLFLN